MLTQAELRRVLSHVAYPGYMFEITERGDALFLFARFAGWDETIQTTRKWYISPHATKSEIVQTALLCVLQSVEHEAREHFTYDMKKVYGPHFSVDVLAEIAAESEVVRSNVS